MTVRAIGYLKAVPGHQGREMTVRAVGYLKAVPELRINPANAVRLSETDTLYAVLGG